MQTLHHRAWLRTLTRKRFRSIPFRALLRQFWSVHGKTIRERLVTMLISWAFIAFWIGVLMLVEYLNRGAA